jgi:hypothetical protein
MAKFSELLEKYFQARLKGEPIDVGYAIKDITDEILPKVHKFIQKVETGQARSVETYKDMKEIREFLNE